MTSRTKVILTKTRKYGLNVIIKLLGICLGSILITIAYNALLVPYGLLTGGVSGLAFIGHYLFNFPINLGILFLNIPIFILGYKELDRSFIFYSFVGTIVMIIALPLTKPFVPPAHIDLILVAIFSGIVNGIGLGIILRFGASTGGNDILSVIMKKKADIPIGTFQFFTNLLILLCSLIFFKLDIMLYSLISIWVSGHAINYVLEGMNRKKSIIIISEKAKIIANKIMKELHRGVTLLNATGAFTGSNRIVINTVVNNFENAKIREIVQDIDPNAFMYITEAIEVSGRGFTLKRSSR